MTQPGQIPAGWYPSPWDPRQLRWWDGHAWTDATAAPPPPAPGYALGSPQQDLDDELGAARVAHLSLIGICLTQIAALFGLAGSVASFVDQVRRQVDAVNANPDNPPVFHLHFPGLFWLVELAGLAGLILLVLFMLWAFRAAQLASRLGLPARHSPGWAIGGFFVPVINLWFPYQSVVDTLPPGHPRRGVVGWWWAAFLLQGVGAWPVFIASFASTTAAMITAACCSVLPVLTLLSARRMIEVIVSAHRELVGVRS
jgi:hypothetical protein